MDPKGASAAFAHVNARLEPYCLRVELSGAARREEWFDRGGRYHAQYLDVIAIPRPLSLPALMDTVVCEWGSEFPAKVSEIRTIFSEPVRIHWVSREQFGLAQFITTGPSNYVAQAKRRWNGRFKANRLEQNVEGVGYRLVETPEELNVFEAFGKPWVEPRLRKSFG